MIFDESCHEQCLLHVLACFFKNGLLLRVKRQFQQTAMNLQLFTLSVTCVYNFPYCFKYLNKCTLSQTLVQPLYVRVWVSKGSQCVGKLTLWWFLPKHFSLISSTSWSSLMASFSLPCSLQWQNIITAGKAEGKALPVYKNSDIQYACTIWMVSSQAVFHLLSCLLTQWHSYIMSSLSKNITRQYCTFLWQNHSINGNTSLIF